MNDDKIKNKLISAYNDVDKIFADFSTLMKIVLYSNFGEKISGLYSLIDDNDKFSKLIDVFDGISIEVPNKEEFKSAVSLTLVYYYKEIMGYSWKKIQSLMPYENDISLKYGSKLKNVKKMIKRKLNKKVEDKIDSLFEI